MGTSTADQALRILTVRLREELGGATPAEHAATRTVRFQTTVLGLATEPGQVCSLTHDDMPGGVGEFRLTGWRLNPDWSIDYQGVTTTDSMYDLVSGPKPGDVTVDPAPGEDTPMPLVGIWHPGYEAAPAGDPLLDPTRKLFTVRQSYFTAADEVTRCLLSVEGYLPVTRFVTNTRPAMRDVAASGTGGNLKADRDYWVSAAARDANGRVSPPALVARVHTPAGADTCQIGAAMTWPAGSWAGYKTYLSDSPHRLCLLDNVASWSGSGPASISWGGSGTPQTSSEGIPIPQKEPRLRVKVKRIVHSGVIGTNIVAVGTGYFDLSPGAGLITANDEFNGRVVSVIADNDGEADLWNFTVTGTALATNRLTVTPDPAVLGITPNDTLIIRTKATTFSATTLGDAKWQNGQYPGGNTNDEAGLLLRIISGKGAGQVRRVASNTVTVHTVDQPFDPAPDATSVWILEEAAWLHQSESSIVPADVPNSLVKIPVEVTNYPQQSLLVLATLVTPDAESSEIDSPWREIWIYGQDALSVSAPTIDPVTGVTLTSPSPAGWSANPDYENLTVSSPKAKVGLTYTPPADPSFTGVDVWTKLAAETVEQAVMRGSFAFAGGATAKVEVEMEIPDGGGPVLFHLASKSAAVSNPPDFSDSAATEPITLNGKNSLTATITGATITTTYYNEESGLFWGPTLDMSLPLSDETWSWCDWTVQWLGVDAEEVLVAGFSRDWLNPVKKIERGWGIPSDDQVTAGNNVFRFRLYLFRNDGTKVLVSNPWGNGTPNKDVTISRQLGSTGAENTPNVTAVGIGTWAEYSTSVDGVSIMRVRAQINRPTIAVKYGGVRVAIAPTATVANMETWIELGHAPANIGVYVTPWVPTPPPGNYKIIFQAYDPMRRYNAYSAGVTPTLDLTITTPAANLLLSRTKGKLTYQGTQSAFEGVEVKAQSGPYSNETVAWMGNATESASTLDLALTAGQITLRVANISPYIGLEGRSLRIVHTNGTTYERFRVTATGINQATRQITMDYTESGSVSFANSYPVNSQVLIDYQGGWFKNLWVGGANAQGAPLYVDTGGNLKIESKGSKHPSMQVDRNGIRTLISNQPNASNPSSEVDGIAMFPVGNGGNYMALGMGGSSGTRSPYLRFTASLFDCFGIDYTSALGAYIASQNLSSSLIDFRLSGNRDGSHSSSYGLGSPTLGLRSFLQIGSILLGWKLIHGAKELVKSTGFLNLEYGQMRFFNSGYSDADVKALLNPGEIATRYNPSGQNTLVAKHNDGSGNAFEWNNTKSL